VLVIAHFTTAAVEGGWFVLQDEQRDLSARNVLPHLKQTLAMIRKGDYSQYLSRALAILPGV
jgi:hypothetical protein